MRFWFASRLTCPSAYQVMCLAGKAAHGLKDKQGGFIISCCDPNIKSSQDVRLLCSALLEVVSKPPLEPNLGVGEKRLILEIPNVLHRLNVFSPPFCPADLWRGILGPIEGFGTTSIDHFFGIDIEFRFRIDKG